MIRISSKMLVIFAAISLTAVLILVTTGGADHEAKAQGSGLRVIVDTHGSDERVRATLYGDETGFSQRITIVPSLFGDGRGEFRTPPGEIPVFSGFTVTGRNSCSSDTAYGENGPERAPERVELYLESCGGFDPEPEPFPPFDPEPPIDEFR